MKKIVLFFSLLLGIGIFAQTDSISVHATFSRDIRELRVLQEIRLHSQKSDSLKLLNWIAAYQSSKTDLAKRKLEDRNSDMHFAKAKDFGELLSLKVSVNGRNLEVNNLIDENIILPIGSQSDGGLNIQLKYVLKLPSSQFTGYGVGRNSAMLKYFFLVPDSFYKNKKRNYLDTEERVSYNTFWEVKIEAPSIYHVAGNLKEIEPRHFASFSNSDPEIYLSIQPVNKMETMVEGKKVVVETAYPLSVYEQSRLEKLLPKQLGFIHQRWGILPEKIFISEKFKNKEDFFGNDDIRWWKFRLPLFAPGDNVELDYISILSKKIVDEVVLVDKEKQHWMTNGLKTYLESQYLNTYFSDYKLLGDLPDNFRFLGLKPLKWFHASQLKLSERYGLAYQYIASQNLDQAINTPYSQLSNFNQMAISQFETGSLLDFVAEKMGTSKFDGWMKQYLQNNPSVWDEKDFLNQLSLASNYTSDFLESYFKTKQRVNFKIKNFKRSENNLLVKVAKKNDLSIPFRLETISFTNQQKINQYWYQTKDGKSKEIYVVPDSAVSKITINNEYFFPEINFRDNYLYTKGLFSNAKKFKFRLIKDIPNPEYNEVYLKPKINFNIYDEVLLGMNFSNASFFTQPFLYSVTPYYSTGTGRFTGSAAVSYSFLPANSFYNSWAFALSGSYFHYTPTLSYRKISAATSMLFSKNPRSSISRSVFASFTHFQRELSAQMILNQEYDQYNIWSLGYGFSDRKLIHEKALGIALQGMEDYTKLTAEAFYRWEYAPSKKVSFRLFAGAFLENKTRNNLFDFGISRVSNYSFSYGLFGQGETDGFWSQQFVLADAGFKSFIPQTSNQWLTALNVDAHAWTIFNIYADFGVYQRRGLATKFIWDSGVKLRLIPDFIEIYFPVQSSLGFEPSFQDYAKRIRFTLTLNLNAIIGTARRGWF